MVLRLRVLVDAEGTAFEHAMCVPLCREWRVLAPSSTFTNHEYVQHAPILSYELFAFYALDCFTACGLARKAVYSTRYSRYTTGSFG